MLKSRSTVGKHKSFGWVSDTVFSLADLPNRSKMYQTYAVSDLHFAKILHFDFRTSRGVYKPFYSLIALWKNVPNYEIVRVLIAYLFFKY
jgi:hypothetical protein